MMQWNLHPAFIVMIALTFGLLREECGRLQDVSFPFPMDIIKGLVKKTKLVISFKRS